MSGINWTDEQVQIYLQELDWQLSLSKGAIILDLEFIVRPGIFEWGGWEYRLYAQREKICLTRAQAILVDDWIQSHKHPPQKPEESTTMSERDTHFFEFAKLLVAELEQQGFITPVHGAYPYTLIARRAYDLVMHAHKSVRTGRMQLASIKGQTDHTPDMTAWPDDISE